MLWNEASLRKSKGTQEINSLTVGFDAFVSLVKDAFMCFSHIFDTSLGMKGCRVWDDCLENEQFECSEHTSMKVVEGANTVIVEAKGARVFDGVETLQAFSLVDLAGIELRTVLC
ncbi:hypothetical protein QVD17_11642 [Tagetes erecta]|uniref:Uncharacterized protein n=1 Tax=Tagetes erecta TaxID=13708 RepID=A0AAD8KUV0_TARER|nr:hypothetical protein QVD17_11642 [Tagetes erecta]